MYAAERRLKPIRERKTENLPMTARAKTAESARRRYPALSIAMHWLSALAVATAFAVAWSRAALDEPQPRAMLMSVHQCAGLLVMALLLGRLGVRLATFRSMAAAPLPRLMRWAAFATHLALYGLLLAMPLLGWALTNAHGHDVRFPGLPVFPPLVDADTDLAETLESWHVGLAWVLGGMVVMHVGAALFHHLVRKDDVLRSMLPVPAEPASDLPRPRPPSPAQGSRSF